MTPSCAPFASVLRSADAISFACELSQVTTENMGALVIKTAMRRLEKKCQSARKTMRSLRGAQKAGSMEKKAAPETPDETHWKSLQHRRLGSISPFFDSISQRAPLLTVQIHASLKSGLESFRSCLCCERRWWQKIPVATHQPSHLTTLRLSLPYCLPDRLACAISRFRGLMMKQSNRTDIQVSKAAGPSSEFKLGRTRGLPTDGLCLLVCSAPCGAWRCPRASSTDSSVGLGS